MSDYENFGIQGVSDPETKSGKPGRRFKEEISLTFLSNDVDNLRDLQMVF